MVQCLHCGVAIRRKNIHRHIAVKHTETDPSLCTVCNRAFKVESQGARTQSSWNFAISERFLKSIVTFVGFLFFVDVSKVQCEYCDKWIHRGTINRHIRNQHHHTELVSCQYCNAEYKNEASLSNHLRTKHGIYK